MSQAEREVLDLYSRIGVRMIWEEHDAAAFVDIAPDQMSLQLSIVRDDVRTPFNSRVLGAASRRPDELRIAIVFYARVERDAGRYGSDPGGVLGLSIAHEAAHLLLPEYEHSMQGLMKSVWNQADLMRAAQGQLRFSDEEAARIRAALAKPF